MMSPMRWMVWVLFLCVGVAAGARTVSVEEINRALELPLFEDTLLWDDSDRDVAARLGWPEESRTVEQASYRSYPTESVRVLGARPFSLALYAEAGRVAEVSLMFANKGDFAGLYHRPVFGERTDPKVEQAQDKIRREALKDFPVAIRTDTETIEAKLTELLGNPQADRFGQTGQTRERVRRWDWNKHAILLASPRGEYVQVRVLPVHVADREGKKERVSDARLRERLSAHVEKRPNGDVVVTQIPMVNQGPKGYCVPATWERYLRYMGIPADMYVLAMAGKTGVGGGTSVNEISENLQPLLARNGRRLDKVSSSVRPSNLSQYIDKGLPLLWGMHVIDSLSREISARTRQRESVTDWTAWRDQLKPARRAANQLKIDPRGSHVCMIIGYNAATKEVATSDSWGPAYAERWLTVEEAEAISQRDALYAILW